MQVRRSSARELRRRAAARGAACQLLAGRDRWCGGRCHHERSAREAGAPTYRRTWQCALAYVKWDSFMHPIGAGCARAMRSSRRRSVGAREQRLCSSKRVLRHLSYCRRAFALALLCSLAAHSRHARLRPHASMPRPLLHASMPHAPCPMHAPALQRSAQWRLCVVGSVQLHRTCGRRARATSSVTSKTRRRSWRRSRSAPDSIRADKSALLDTIVV